MPTPGGPQISQACGGRPLRSARETIASAPSCPIRRVGLARMIDAFDAVGLDDVLRAGALGHAVSLTQTRGHGGPDRLRHGFSSALASITTQRSGARLRDVEEGLAQAFVETDVELLEARFPPRARASARLQALPRARDRSRIRR